MTKIFDVAIVGGGPAGLTAALWLGRYLHSVVVIDSGDPRNWETRGVNGYLGISDVRPADLRGHGRDEARKYDVELVDGFVTRVRRESDDLFELDYDPMAETKAGEDAEGPGTPRAADDNAPTHETCSLRAKRLLLAFGLKDEWPRLPGLRQVYGSTAHVCPDCDGYETRDKKVAVIASGRKAVGMALSLTTWTRDIVICTNGDAADMDAELCTKLEALNIPVLTQPISCIHPRGDQIDFIELADGMPLDCDEIFFALSQRPADDLGAQLKCDRDDDGHIITDDRCHTSVYNCFAAGDVAPGAQLAIVAAAEGAIAALSIHRSLVPDARKLEPLRKPGEAAPIATASASAH